MVPGPDTLKKMKMQNIPNLC